MSTFHTIGVSDARFEPDGLRQVTFKSRALERRVDMTLYVPADLAAPAPWVTLLHGVYGSHWAWALKGGAHVTAARLIAEGVLPPMVLAMPSDGLWGDGSGYLRHRAHASRGDYETYIVDEVAAAVCEVVPAVTGESARVITGLSMGGFGALRIGAKFGPRFRAIAGHSSITEFSQMKQFVEEPLEAYGTIPAEDQSVLATMLARRHELPPIRFDCGTEDQLLEANRALHRGLDAAGIGHEYHESPGGHEWPYWEREIEATLRWVGKLLRA